MEPGAFILLSVMVIAFVGIMIVMIDIHKE